MSIGIYLLQIPGMRSYCTQFNGSQSSSDRSQNGGYFGTPESSIQRRIRIPGFGICCMEKDRVKNFFLGHEHHINITRRLEVKGKEHDWNQLKIRGRKNWTI
ncbi:hypothetical protein DCMF_12910 [Candidatus Formimonas warabiya]|uniref:Uncharacterized protein n=1 Tax=Formimonas warabiya TaxID=1761012 RepID=A0A3G1KSW3_FORW1|nr:hypothetical protein DCMF_12910 [Candidatus Formimonas warabiya]